MKDADARLRELGFDGTRLLGLARDCANHHCNRIPYAPPGLADELASFLLEQALRATMRYDPTLSGGGGSYTFPSYLWDVMNMRVADFYRRKSEGFGDSRSGSNDRLVLAGDPLEEIADPVVEDVAFAPDTREAAEELADEIGLSLMGTWTLTELVARRADGALPTAAAAEVGIGVVRAGRRLEELRSELSERGYGEAADALD